MVSILCSYRQKETTNRVGKGVWVLGHNAVFLAQALISLFHWRHDHRPVVRVEESLGRVCVSQLACCLLTRRPGRRFVRRAKCRCSETSFRDPSPAVWKTGARR
jgi:hypothetical protein